MFYHDDEVIFPEPSLLDSQSREVYLDQCNSRASHFLFPNSAGESQNIFELSVLNTRVLPSSSLKKELVPSLVPEWNSSFPSPQLCRLGSIHLTQPNLNVVS